MDQIINCHPLPLCFAAPVNWYAENINKAVIEIADEQTFERQTLRNRFHYGSFQGTKLFTIPLNQATTKKAYQNVTINNHEHWQNHLINAIQTSYGKSPFYEFYGYRFEKIIRSDYEFLWELNMAVLHETLKCLKIEIPLEFIKVDNVKIIQRQAFVKYYQVFQEKIDFQPHLSILDLLYNEGPDTYDILLKSNKLII